jgi:hypothetical protein
VVALVKGLEISLNTSQRMGVINLVITYKIDGGNLIDFYPSFLSTVNAIVIAQKFPFNNKITNLFIYHLNGLITVLVVVEPFNSVIIKTH